MKFNKYLWITDPHLNNLLPWQKYLFLSKIKKENPVALFITGDLSNSVWLTHDLKMLAKLGYPIFYIKGNHELFWSSIEEVKTKIRKVSAQFKNLIYLEDESVVPLNDNTCVIGVDGWFDNDIGDPKWLRWKLEGWIIKDFIKLSFKNQLKKFKEMAEYSCQQIEKKLKLAIEQNFKTIYILSHFPGWYELTDYESKVNWFWAAYNSNPSFGKIIEKVMANHKDKKVICLHGHTHHPEYIRVSSNIECQVGKAHFIGVPHSQKIYL